MNLNECREHLTLTLECGRSQKVKLMGTTADPYFCGKDVCELLGYSDIKQALQHNVDEEDKKDLKSLIELGVRHTPNSMVLGNHNISVGYHDGKAIYVNEPGLYSLILSSKAPFAKAFKKLVCGTILPSIRLYGSYEVNQQFKLKDEAISNAMAQLTIRDQSEAVLREELERKAEELRLKDEAEAQLKAELQKEHENHKRVVKRMIDFHKATVKVEPKEYVYISTTDPYQQRNVYKVGGVAEFKGLRSRRSQYHSGSLDEDRSYYIHIRKVVSYRVIEDMLKSCIGSFRQNLTGELYIIPIDWLIKIVDAAVDGNESFLAFVNENRSTMVNDVLNKEPTIKPPIELERVSLLYERHGEEPQELSTTIDPELIQNLTDAFDTFEPHDNLVKRREFEEHLFRLNPTIATQPKRPLWKSIKLIGASINQNLRFKYN